MRTTNSSTGRAAKFLMSKEERMKKDKLLVSGEITKEDINNGKSSMLIPLIKIELRVSIRNMDFTSTDHSTSDQECQCRE
jgi:hypothetical protein